jgi:hypothetical protein
MQFVPENARGTNSWQYPFVAEWRDPRGFVPHRDAAGD